MKKIIVIACFFTSCIAFSAFAQNEVSYGIKGGLNMAVSPDRDNPAGLGFNVGLVTKVDFGGIFYLMPELTYNNLNVPEDADDNSSSVNYSNISLPVLVGIKFLKVLSIFGGPGVQYLIDAKSNKYDIDITDIDSRFTFFADAGVGFNIPHFGVNLRLGIPINPSSSRVDVQDRVTGDVEYSQTLNNVQLSLSVMITF